MTTADYFRVLEPPAGGLERLRKRIAQPRHRRFLQPVMGCASLAVGAILLTSVWVTFDSARQEQQAIAELESIFTSARQPPLTINGTQPVELELGRDDLIAFWLEEID